MHVYVALLYIFLMAAPECTSLPLQEESTRNTIHAFAQTTLVHISKLKATLLVAIQVEVTAPPIEGLSGICRDLGHLDNELQNPFTDYFSQIEADVSSLEARVRFLAGTMGCPIHAKPTAKPADNSFPHIDIYQTLIKVEKYLGNLLQNKDKLRVC